MNFSYHVFTQSPREQGTFLLEVTPICASHISGQTNVVTCSQISVNCISKFMADVFVFEVRLTFFELSNHQDACYDKHTQTQLSNFSKALAYVGLLSYGCNCKFTFILQIQQTGVHICVTLRVVCLQHAHVSSQSTITSSQRNDQLWSTVGLKIMQIWRAVSEGVATQPGWILTIC